MKKSMFFRDPKIVELAILIGRFEDQVFDETGRRRFMLIMEQPKGSIYREVIDIPADKTDDVEFVAAAFARGWASIWQQVSRSIGKPDAVDVEITPHWGFCVADSTIDTKNLFSRPGRFIGVNGAIEPHAIEPKEIE